MSLYGVEYEEEIDEIEELALQHLEKYGKDDIYGCNERIMGAIASAYSKYMYKNENKN